MAATRLTTLPIVFLVAICLLAPFGTARGADTYWQHDPATPGDWFDPLNWSAGVPSSMDHARIENNGTAFIDGGGAEAGSVYLASDTGSGTLNLLSGTLTAGSLLASYDGGTGTLNVSNGWLDVDYFVGGVLTIANLSARISVKNILFSGADSSLEAAAGSTIHMTTLAPGESGSLVLDSTEGSRMTGLGNLTIVFDSYDSGQGGFSLLEAASTDMGRTPVGFIDNLAFGAIEVEGGALVYFRDLTSDSTPESQAVYVDKLTLASGSRISLVEIGAHGWGVTPVYVRELDDQGGAVFNGELISMIPGDADGNWKVDSADLATWQQNYDPLGDNADTFDRGDWDGNGRIDSADLALWQRNYNPLGMMGVSPEVTPEPATLLLLGSGLLGMTRLNRRKLRA